MCRIRGRYVRELIHLIGDERRTHDLQPGDVFDVCERFTDALEVRLSQIVYDTSRDVRQDFESLKFRFVRSGTLHAAGEEREEGNVAPVAMCRPSHHP